MTLKLPDETKHARIVHQLNGPVQRLQLRHIPSNWVIHSEGKGPDLAACVEALRRRVVMQGYVVDEGFDVEDWRWTTKQMRRLDCICNARATTLNLGSSLDTSCLTPWFSTRYSTWA